MAPRNGLFRLCWQAFSPAFGLDFAAQARNHRAGGGQPLFRPCDRGVRPRRLFHRFPAGPGLADFEAAEAGAVWRFRNEGNRASFVAHPEIYGPQFGGYDPVDLGRGVTYAGNPRFWVIAGQRLYLFGREENRDAFAADPARFLKDATLRWPALEDRAWRSRFSAARQPPRRIAPGDEFRHDEVLALRAPKCKCGAL